MFQIYNKTVFDRVTHGLECAILTHITRSSALNQKYIYSRDKYFWIHDL